MDKKALEKTVANHVGVFKEIARNAINEYEQHRNKHTETDILGATPESIAAHEERVRQIISGASTQNSGSYFINGKEASREEFEEHNRRKIEELFPTKTP